MIDAIRHAILDAWETLPVSRPRPERLECWLDGTGAEKMCVFLLAPGDREPCLVAKAARSKAGERVLRHEQRLSSRMRSLCPVDVSAAIPEQVLLPLSDGRMAIAEAYAPGRSLAREMSGVSAANAVRLVCAPLEWLGRFGRATRLPASERVIRAGRRIVELEARYFTHAFPLDDPSTAFVGHVVESGEAWLAEGGTLVPVHGDFEPGNVLIGESGLSIVDWGFGRPLGLPGGDLCFALLRFLILQAGLSRMQAEPAEYRGLLDVAMQPGSWQNEFVGAAFAAYWMALELPPTDPRWVAGLALLTMANTYHRYLLDRADWSWLFLPPGSESRPYQDALADLGYAHLFRHLAHVG